MAKTIKLAKQRGVGVGAHPGFADLVGFGRRRLDLPIKTIQNQIRYQIGAIKGMANAQGTEQVLFPIRRTVSIVGPCLDRTVTVAATATAGRQIG